MSEAAHASPIALSHCPPRLVWNTFILAKWSFPKSRTKNCGVRAMSLVESPNEPTKDVNLIPSDFSGRDPQYSTKNTPDAVVVGEPCCYAPQAQVQPSYDRASTEYSVALVARLCIRHLRCSAPRNLSMETPGETLIVNEPTDVFLVACAEFRDGNQRLVEEIHAGTVQDKRKQSAVIVHFNPFPSCTNHNR